MPKKISVIIRLLCSQINNLDSFIFRMFLIRRDNPPYKYNKSDFLLLFLHLNPLYDKDFCPDFLLLSLKYYPYQEFRLLLSRCKIQEICPVAFQTFLLIHFLQIIFYFLLIILICRIQKICKDFCKLSVI